MQYAAQIYEDVSELDTRTKVEIGSTEVTKDTILEFQLESSGGAAIYL
ncbi:hypothetical protein QFZ80_001377 [Paenibacillus sp. V4I7]|nr:hypothetical protein [Paenibacillus sp. V4I7]